MRMATDQDFRLQEELEEAGVTHGGRVRADLEYVAVTGIGSGRPAIAFCDMKPVGIREVLERGDGESLPMEAQVDVPETLFPRDGVYDLFNVSISTNGRNAVRADNASQARLADAYAGA